MIWLTRYRIRHYVTNSFWILPLASIVAALATARLLHAIEEAEGWESTIHPETARAVLGTWLHRCSHKSSRTSASSKQQCTRWRRPWESNMRFKRIVALLALAAGSLGFVACMTGAYPVSVVKTRLDRTNDRVFVTIDKGLAAAQDRVREVQERVRESKIRTSEIAPKLREWRAGNAKVRLTLAVEIKSRIEGIVGRLQAADQLLRKTMDSIGGIHDALEWLVLIGVPADSIAPESVLEKLASTQSKLQGIVRSIKDVGEITVNRVSESEENRLPRVLGLLGNWELTAGTIDAHLEDTANRLSQVQADAQQLKARISNYILFTTIGGCVVFAWIAAGQAALCLFGWKNCSRSRSSA